MKQEIRFQVLGWTLFVVCALFYLVASIESGSTLSLVGSVVFLVACFVFMVPVVRRWWYG